MARAYRRSPVEALIAAAYLGTGELDDPVDIRVSLADVIGADLGGEVLRRLTTLEIITAAGTEA